MLFCIPAVWSAIVLVPVVVWPVVVRVPAMLSTPGFGLTQILVVVHISIVVEVLVEWSRHASTLLLATLLIALVSGVEMLVAVAAFVLVGGFLISESETILTTNEQISASLVSLSSPRTVALVELLLTPTPSQKPRPHMWQL